MKQFIIMFLLSMVLVSSVGADDIDKHSLLYMDVIVKSVSADRKVVFINSAGDEFEFTNVLKPFKPGDKVTLEVEADFIGEVFRVVGMDCNAINDTLLTYPDNRRDEWKLHLELVVTVMVFMLGSYLLGHINQQRNKKKGGIRYV